MNQLIDFNNYSISLTLKTLLKDRTTQKNIIWATDTYELPVSAVREIIVNAVLHRSYMDDACIQVSIFDDRIEIDSPGMLYDGLSVQDALSGKSKCRNKAIAEAFEYMKIIEGWGTRLPRLFKNCEEMGLPKPKFEEYDDGIKVTIYRSIDKKEDIYSLNQSKENMKVNETEQQMVQLFKDNPQITISELADKMGFSESGIRYAMRQMRKKGFLVREGSRKNGRWIVKE